MEQNKTIKLIQESAYLQGFEEIIGYSFEDKALLKQIFTFKNYAAKENKDLDFEYRMFEKGIEDNYYISGKHEDDIFENLKDSYTSCFEPLEFLGDRVFNLIIAEEMNKRYYYNVFASNEFSDLISTQSLLEAKENFEKIYFFKLNYLNILHEKNMDSKKNADLIEAIIGGMFMDIARGNKNFSPLKKFVLETLEYGKKIKRINPNTYVETQCNKENYVSLNKSDNLTNYETEQISKIEKAIGYQFKNKAILMQALTGTEYSNFKNLAKYKKIIENGYISPETQTINEKYYKKKFEHIKIALGENYVNSCKSLSSFGERVYDYAMAHYMLDITLSYGIMGQTMGFIANKEVLLKVIERAEKNNNFELKLLRRLGTDISIDKVDIFRSILAGVYLDSSKNIGKIQDILFNTFNLNKAVIYALSNPKEFIRPKINNQMFSQIFKQVNC